MRRRLPRVLFHLPVFILILHCPLPVSGQEEVTAILRGEARLGDALLRSGVVVLHQVSAEAAGEIDSVTVQSDGSFSFRLPHVPDHASRPEIFFASLRYSGLHYFGPAITDAVQLDSLYLIQAYDTASVQPGGADLPLAARNLYLEPAEGGWLATDVFLVLNEGDRTLYSPEDGVVWKYPLPESIADFELGQGEMAPDAVRYTEGLLEVYSPLPPGERNLMVRYRITSRDFVLPMPGRTDEMEILLPEPAPEAGFPPLILAAPMEMGPGNTFRRYTGRNLLDLEIASDFEAPPVTFPGEAIALLMAAVLGAAGVFGYRRRSGKGAPPGSGGEGARREDLLLAIARLDEDFQALGDPSPEARSTYEARRRELLARLKRLS